MKYYHSSFRLISLILSTCHYLSCSNIRIAHGFVLVPVKTSSLKTLSIKNVQTKKVNNPLPSILENDKRGGAILAWPLTKDPKEMAPDFPLTITITSARIAITITSTVATWYAQHFLGHSNVMASAAFTLICSMCLDKRLGQATICGTFAGMCSMTLIPNIYWALALGGLTSLLFEIIIHAKNMFLGIGGRLGATAFLATSVIASIRGISTDLFSKSNISILSSIQNSQIALSEMILWYAIGSIATIALREASDDTAAYDPVRASSVIGLIGALLMKNKTAILAIYGGSSVGRSLPSKLMYGILPGKLKEGAKLPIPSTLVLLSAFGIAGALGGTWHGISNAMGFWPGSWGGKAGFFAFIGCLCFRGLGKASALVSKNDVAFDLS